MQVGAPARQSAGFVGRALQDQGLHPGPVSRWVVVTCKKKMARFSANVLCEPLYM